jgi:hypothetical protein
LLVVHIPATNIKLIGRSFYLLSSICISDRFQTITDEPGTALNRRTRKKEKEREREREKERERGGGRGRKDGRKREKIREIEQMNREKDRIDGERQKGKRKVGRGEEEKETTR